MLHSTFRYGSYTVQLQCVGQSNSASKNAKPSLEWITVNQGHGIHGTGIRFLFCWRTYLFRNSDCDLKKTPILTFPQARKLVIAALSGDQKAIVKVISTVLYYNKRNYASYLSFRRKKLLQLNE